MSESTPEGAAARLVNDLRQALADLQGYIDRQARVLAEPWIVASQNVADERVRCAEFETRRQEELVGEMRRQLKPLNDHFERTRWATARAGRRFYLNVDDGFASLQCTSETCDDLLIFVDPSDNLLEKVEKAAQHRCGVKP